MTIVAVIVGQLLDAFIGDPPKFPHPVRWIGSFIIFLTNRFNKGSYRFLKGMITGILVVSVVAITTFLIVYLAYKIHVIVGILIEGVLIGIGLAQKSLKEATMEVYHALIAGDLNEARKNYRGLWGAIPNI